MEECPLEEGLVGEEGNSGSRGMWNDWVSSVNIVFEKSSFYGMEIYWKRLKVKEFYKGNSTEKALQKYRRSR